MRVVVHRRGNILSQENVRLEDVDRTCEWLESILNRKHELECCSMEEKS